MWNWKALGVSRVKAEAEKELGAFLTAVAQVLGEGEVEHAADLWLTLLESTDWNVDDDPKDVFRHITINIASRLAREATESLVSKNA